LHVCPEAAVGGPLACVRDGDMITLDVPARRLDVDVSDDEMERRRAEWVAPALDWAERGYPRLHMQHVQQADEGCDLDFLAKRPYTAKTP
jgi:dihydroxy-acid dehydratase